VDALSLNRSWLAAGGDMAAASRSVGRSLLPLLFVEHTSLIYKHTESRFENNTIEYGQFDFLYIDMTSPAIPFEYLLPSIDEVILTTTKARPNCTRGDLGRLGLCLSIPPHLLAIREDRSRNHAADRRL
jgi:hypothetical protein